MDRRLKTTAIVLLITGLMAAVALASSLPNLTLGPGQPFPGAGPSSGIAPNSPAARTAAAAQSWSMLTGILAAILVALFIYLLVHLLSFTNIKRLLGVIVVTALVLFLLLSLPRVEPGPPTILPPESIATAPALPTYTVTPLGEPPAQLLWVVGLAILLGGGLVAWILVRRSPAAARLVLKEATRGVQDLRSGMDSTDVVIRSYLQMTRVLQQERGVERGRSLTVREFETSIESLGLPRVPLWRLRELFETVRYGNRPLRADEVGAATQALSEIVAALHAGAS